MRDQGGSGSSGVSVSFPVSLNAVAQDSEIPSDLFFWFDIALLQVPPGTCFSKDSGLYYKDGEKK